MFVMNKFKPKILIRMTRPSLGSKGFHTSGRSYQEYGPKNVQRSCLSTGVRIACTKTCGAPMTSATIMFLAGSRYEVNEEIGASHFLRAASGGSGTYFSEFAKARHLQQCGGYITCNSDRQSISYTLTCPPTHFSDLKYYLLDVACGCHYHQWELEDRFGMIKDDLVRMRPEQRCLDLVQRASFRGPLSNSIFCEHSRIKGMKSETLNTFAKDYFVADRCCVGTIGVPFEEAMKLAEKLTFGRNLRVCRTEEISCARAGYEYYDMGPGSETYIAVALPGCGALNFCTLLNLGIIAEACGQGPIQSGTHHLDRSLQPPLGNITPDPYTNFRAFNISYLDAGIFGILAQSRPCSSHDTGKAAAVFLCNIGDLDFKQIEVGKQRLKVSIARFDDDVRQASEGLALQCAHNLRIDDPSVILGMIDGIQPDETKCMAESLAKCSDMMSVAVVGDVASAPDALEIRGCL